MLVLKRIRDHASPEFGIYEIFISRAEGDEVYLPTVWVMNWLPAANLSCSWHDISSMRHPWWSRTNNIHIYLLASWNLLQLHRNNIINVEMDWEWSLKNLGNVSSSAEMGLGNFQPRWRKCQETCYTGLVERHLRYALCHTRMGGPPMLPCRSWGRTWDACIAHQILAAKPAQIGAITVLRHFSDSLFLVSNPGRFRHL